MDGVGPSIIQKSKLQNRLNYDAQILYMNQKLVQLTFIFDMTTAHDSIIQLNLSMIFNFSEIRW